MSYLPPRSLLMLRSMVLTLAACLLRLACGESARAATIGPGDVTASLGPTFFVDDTGTGGGDVTITQPTVAFYNRSFAGLLNANQGLSRVTLTGSGFATSTAAGENTATSLTVTFTYLGEDEVVGGGDDVVMGVRRLRSCVNHRRCSRSYRAALATARRYCRRERRHRIPRGDCRAGECAETRAAHRGSTEVANGRSHPCARRARSPNQCATPARAALGHRCRERNSDASCRHQGVR